MKLCSNTMPVLGLLAQKNQNLKTLAAFQTWQLRCHSVHCFQSARFLCCHWCGFLAVQQDLYLAQNWSRALQWVKIHSRYLQRICTNSRSQHQRRALWPCHAKHWGRPCVQGGPISRKHLGHLPKITASSHAIFALWPPNRLAKTKICLIARFLKFV